uniref:BI1-like protein n=1 Tax=Aegilops tauschii TaxID=37682 RepID=M8AUY6_AEGTA
MKGGDIEAGGDVEAGTAAPYPGTTESPELRWALIRKIYVVLCLQLLLTAVVAVVVVKVRAIPHFFVSSYAGLGLYIFILILPFIGKVILQAGILTIVVVLSLTAYTFWAARRGKDFSFLGPFLFASLMILLVFGFIQIFFPLGKLSHMIYGALAALIFSGYIVYDTGSIIKRYKYDEYVWAAVTLYLDIINLFLGLLTLFRACDN